MTNTSHEGMDSSLVPGSTHLLLIGTVVHCPEEGKQHGIVMPYQQYSPTQKTFPVCFDGHWCTMSLAVLVIDPEQPPNRRRPEPIGRRQASDNETGIDG
ncbi:hypothetical protein AB0878_46230 [Amycolatopsis sp. NPDC047767]|uniref:hypothetical protein n=1 Tax=Amycolatopsis sp. NPDC047767 TaxID=3156765 RepID=UPI003454DA88